MSLAVLKVLLARTLKHPPTKEEMAEFLAHCQQLSVERIYVPHRQPSAFDVEQVLQLRHLSVRKIARATGYSKSHVQRVLSQNP